MPYCKSGKHLWMMSRDAEKCCNGYVEKIVLSTRFPDGRELTAKEKVNMICLDDLGFYHVWEKEESQ